MTCAYCRTLNSDDDHRCRRCGRRLSTAAADEFSEARPVMHVSGALAARMQPEARPAGAIREPAQRALFVDRAQPKVIPFDSLSGPRAETQSAAPPTKAAPRAPARRQPARAPDSQSRLDFLPPAPQHARKLRTTVEAVIYCDAPVATKMHRALAAALDASMVLIGFAVFLLAYLACGGGIEFNRPTLLTCGGALVLIAFFYWLVWLIAFADTPGERWTRLKLINFDGFPPDNSQRLLRFAGTCLGLCTGGIGMLWAVVDEESLSWHDHISKTFLTLEEKHTNFFRQR